MAKMPLQEKIAELERRIVALEQQGGAEAWTTRTTARGVSLDMEPELGWLWKSDVRWCGGDGLFCGCKGAVVRSGRERMTQ